MFTAIIVRMKTRGERLRHARKRAGFKSALQAAKALNMKAPTYNAHERAEQPGGRDFGPDEAARYGRRFKCSDIWLLTGAGSIERQLRDSALRLAKPSLIETFDPDERDDKNTPIAAVYTGGRRHVPEGEIPRVAAKLGLGEATNANIIQIPVGVADVAAVEVVDTWKVPESILRRRLVGRLTDVHIVECEGDSMEPRIHDGDFVFIDTSRRVPSPPGIFAINDGYSQTLKRIELIPNTEPTRVKIIPENPRHSTYERTLDEIDVIGRYVCRLTMD